MEIIEVTKKEFNNVISNPFHIYGTTHFNRLNEEKCESVYYLLFKENKYRLGIIGGIINDIFLSSYSAPFGGFLFIKSNIRIYNIDSAIDLLIEWGKTKKLKTINLTLPPSIYNETFISKQINSLYRKKFAVSRLEVNYAFDTDKFDDGYINDIWSNAGKHLKNAFNRNLKFHKCENISEKRVAYEVIKQNKEAKGFPLRMTWKQIFNTMTVINADFFLLSNFDDAPIASAIIFYVGKSIVQVIYWGDIPKYSHLRTMNFLSYKIFEYYKSKKYKIVDLGPSSENSIPNFGLCEFKESIGCDISTKLNFIFNLI